MEHLTYVVEIGKQASKQLNEVPATEQSRLREKIRELATEPRPTMAKKLRGHSDTYRIRQGNYRVIYSVNDKVLVVKVEKIGHRKDIYE